MNVRRAFLWAMVGITLLAWAVFIAQIGLQGMWVDEWFSWSESSQGLVSTVQMVAQGDVHPPFFYQLLNIWRTVTGSEDLAIMRLFSAICALLSVALVYRTAADWFGNLWVGLGAAGYLAVSGVFITFARELRMYALTSLLVILSWWLLLRVIRGRRSAWLAYGAVIALMAYTYYFSAFVVLMQVFVVLGFARRRLAALLAAFSLVLTALLPWLPALAQQIAHEREWSGVSDERFIGKFSATTSTTVESLTNFVNLYTNGQPGLVLLLIVAASLTLFSHRYRHNSNWRRAVTAALLWSVGTVSAFFVINLAIPVYNPRYPLFALPGLALLAGAALSWLPAGRLRALGIVALVAWGFAVHPAGMFPPHAPHQDLLARIADGYEVGDQIVYSVERPFGNPRSADPLNYYIQAGIGALPADAFITSPDALSGSARRLWIVGATDSPGPVEEGSSPIRWLTEDNRVGNYAVRLYEQLPALEPTHLGDSLALLATDSERALAPGETAVFRTWWRARSPLAVDYSYTLILRDAAGQTVTQVDAGLNAEGLPTSLWTETWRFAPLPILLPENLPSGDYSVWLGVYDWRNPVRLPVASGSMPLDEAQALVNTGRVRVR